MEDAAVPEPTPLPAAAPIDRDLTIYHVAELKPRLLAWLQDGGSTLSLACAQESGGGACLRATHHCFARAAPRGASADSPRCPMLRSTWPKARSTR